MRKTAWSIKVSMPNTNQMLFCRPKTTRHKKKNGCEESAYEKDAVKVHGYNCITPSKVTDREVET